MTPNAQCPWFALALVGFLVVYRNSFTEIVKNCLSVLKIRCWSVDGQKWKRFLIDWLTTLSYWILRATCIHWLPAEATRLRANHQPALHPGSWERFDRIGQKQPTEEGRLYAFVVLQNERFNSLSYKTYPKSVLHRNSPLIGWQGHIYLFTVTTTAASIKMFSRI